MPVLAMDYCLLAVDEKDSETATTLVIRDDLSSYTGAAVVPEKVQAAELRRGFGEVTIASRKLGETHLVASFVAFRAAALPAAFLGAAHGEAVLVVASAAFRDVSVTVLGVALAADRLSGRAGTVYLASALQVGKGIVGSPRESACVTMASLRAGGSRVTRITRSQAGRP